MNTYLGDGVYATDTLNSGYVTLTTGHHDPSVADNIIHLDPSVIDTLIVFLQCVKDAPIEAKFRAIIALIPEELQERVQPYGKTQIDIDNLTHEESLSTMRALRAGRWDRSESGVEGRLDYRAEIDGIIVRLWAAAPPDSCRVIEEEYEIPASRMVRKRIICKEPTTPDEQ